MRRALNKAYPDKLVRFDTSAKGIYSAMSIALQNHRYGAYQWFPRIYGLVEEEENNAGEANS